MSADQVSVEATAAEPYPAPSRRRRRWLGLLLLVALAVGTVAVLGVGFGRDPRVVRSVLLDRPAPPLTGETLQGGSFDLADVRGRVAVVNVWASWCVACREEHPELVAASRELEPHGVQFIGIDTQDTIKGARAFEAKMGAFGYPSVLDPDGRKMVDWGAFGVPETFLIDVTGQVRAKYVGAVNRAWLVTNARDLVAEAEAGCAGRGPTYCAP